MDTSMPPTPLDLAAEHGLHLEPSSLRFEEMGLDFRIAFARDADGRDWVLRIPRRPDASERAEVEARLLAFIGPRLDVAVPDWRIRSDRLIAYPLLPGEPGLTVGADGGVSWRVDMASAEYARSLAEVLAQLHALDADMAAATGIPRRGAAEERERRRSDLERVASAFEISPALRESWEAWLADDGLWPELAVPTHGEVYPAHTLVEGGRITAVIDWTTAAVGDPARDLQFHCASAPEESFTALLEHYRELGGEPGDRIVDRCRALFSASPLEYGLYALETGDPAHREAAAAALNPPAET
ncbi:macrolide 2'-phosphotransferase [Brachybacterium sp. DNPG3]